MIDRTAPNEPYAPPAPLEAIVADLREFGIRPTRLGVIRRAIEIGHDEEAATALADALKDEALLAPLAMAEHMAERRGEHRR